MKPDLYTKCVLTVIALSVLLLATQNALSLRVVSAQGTDRPQKVTLVDQSGLSILASENSLTSSYFPVKIVGLGSNLSVPVQIVAPALGLPVQVSGVVELAGPSAVRQDKSKKQTK